MDNASINRSFSALGLSEDLNQVIAEVGYKGMTDIQAQAIPPILSGRDLIGQSKTGSGKTAAFVLPVLANLQIRHRSIQTLILCPTRELCTQVARECRLLGRRLPGLHVVILSGGQPIRPQLAALDQGAHIAVGTPGRIMDHIKRGSLDLRGLKTLVLDEADRMLDMGFELDVDFVIRKTPQKKQTVFFSATFPESITEMSAKYQNDPVKLTIVDTEVKKIRQCFYPSTADERKSAMLAVMQLQKPGSAIVFCNLKATAADLVNDLFNAGLSAAAIHGDLEQFDRDRVMARFRNQSVRVLVATDVLSRGIDVEAIDLVLNYDLPSSPEIYVHRIGRTGRAGNAGLAVNLFGPRDAFKRSNIEEYTKEPWLPLTGPSAAPNTSKKTALAPAAMETIYISAGRKDKMRPGDILGALTGDAGRLAASNIGKIEIHDRFSYVAVSRSVAERAMLSLRNGRIKGRKCQVDIVR